MKKILLTLLAVVAIGLSASAATSFNDFKAFIEAHNRLCPVDMPPIGQIESITVDDNSRSLIYTVSVTSDVLSYELMDSQRDAIKNTFAQVLSTADVKPMAAACLQYGVSLTFRFKWSPAQILDFSFSTAEIRSILSTETPEAVVRKNLVDQMVEREHARCPEDQGDGMILTDVYRSDNVVYYEFTIDETIYDVNDLNRDNSAMRRQTEQYFEPRVMREPLKSMVACDYQLHFVYIGNTSGMVYEMILTVDDLQRLINKK